MRLNKTKNTIRNSVWGLLNKFFTTFLPFLLRAVMIRTVGISYLGIDGLFSAVLQVLNMSELGFSVAVTYCMYKPIAENDTKTICALLAFYRRVYHFVGGAIFCLGGILLPFAPRLAHGGFPESLNIYAVFIIFLFNTGVSYFLFAYKSVLLTSYQKNYVLSNVRTLLLLFRYTAQVCVLLFLRNYYIYAICIPLMTVLHNIAVGIITKRIFPQYVPQGTINKSVLAEIKRQVAGQFVSALSATTRNSFDNIFVSMSFGLTMTAIYSNYYCIILGVTGFLDVLCVSMSAGIANNIVLDSVENNFQLMKKITVLFGVLITLATSCLLNVYQPFVRLWVGKDYLLEFPVMLLFVIYFYVGMIMDVAAQFFNGAGLNWKGRYRSVLGSVVNIVLNLLLLKIFGVLGIVLASVLSVVFITDLYGLQILFKNYFGIEKMGGYCFLLFYNAIVTVVACVASFVVCSFITESSVASVILRFLVSLCIALLIAILFYIRNPYVKSFAELLCKKCSR